jgi:hypothetical protein
MTPNEEVLLTGQLLVDFCSQICCADEDVRVKSPLEDVSIRFNLSPMLFGSRIHVYYPEDTKLGIVDSRCCSSSFFIDCDSSGQRLEMRENPCFGCCVDENFTIMNDSGEKIGAFTKKCRNGYSAKYELTFPDKLDLRMKILIMGACTLVVINYQKYCF